MGAQRVGGRFYKKGRDKDKSGANYNEGGLGGVYIVLVPLLNTYALAVSI